LHSGYSFRSHNILKAQRKKGWESIGLTSSKHELNLHKGTPGLDNIDGVSYYRSGLVSKLKFPGQQEWLIVKNLYHRIQEIIQLEEPDLLHVHSPWLNALPAIRIGSQLGLPVIYEVRAFWEDAAVDHGTYSRNSLKYQMVKGVETWVCRRAAQVAVICQGIRSDLISRGIPAEKLTVVYNGIDPDDFLPCERDEEYEASWKLAGKFVIGFIGSFYRYEGLDLLVTAFERLIKHLKNSVLLLVGGGEVESELKSQIEQLKIQESVIMPGRIPHHRIPGVYALMDVMVYPRYSMRLTELVTPLKPLEAMAVGKVVIASDIGGHRELIRPNETGLLFRAGDVSTLVESLVKVLDDQVLRSGLEKQATHWVGQEHTWDKTTSVYSDIYAKALDGGQSS
jgi:PEP-CTERM/exosortase A-associated glycosyltransferase